MPDPSQTHGFDPHAVAENLVLGEDGVWFSRDREPISYDADGNAQCFQLEEGSFWFAHRAACLHSVVKRFAPNRTIFDIGGGNGFVSVKLREAGFDTVLVEPGEVGARNAARRGLPAVICATLATARFRAESMDAAGMFDVIEHIPDDLGFLREVHRCLKPGGRIFITVPAFEWLWSHDDVKAGHFRRYTIGGAVETLANAGFRTLYATYLFSLLPLPLFAVRSVPSLFGRRVLPAQSYSGLHKPRARGFTDRVWEWEQRQVESGGTIPFGSSCLLVAEKR